MDLILNTSPENALNMVIEEITHGSLSGVLVDQYNISTTQGECLIAVFEKYYMRNSSRASLTVVINNLNGITKVHAVGSGGGQGAILGFDWGARGSFENYVTNALEEYVAYDSAEDQPEYVSYSNNDNKNDWF